MQLAVVSADLSVPPAAPQNGDRYIVASPGSGDWTDHSGEVAVFTDGYWSSVPPQEGWSAKVLTPKGRLVYDRVAGWEAPAVASA